MKRVAVFILLLFFVALLSADVFSAFAYAPEPESRVLSSRLSGIMFTGTGFPVEFQARVIWPTRNGAINQILPFGKSLAEDTPEFESYKLTFTSKELDHDLDLHYFGARYYHAFLPRFISPDPDHVDRYTNFEINCRGVCMDSRPGTPNRKAWNAEGLECAGQIMGTLNDDADTDLCWTMEVTIPFKNFGCYAKRVPPKPGDIWRMGFNRCGGKTNEQYSQWSSSCTERPRFHYPPRFGIVKFSDVRVDQAKAARAAAEGPTSLMTRPRPWRPNSTKPRLSAPQTSSVPAWG